HYGRDEFLRRLSHQSFGAVMGMDWHSSGITTSVIGALKRGLAPLESELGIHVCGGDVNAYLKEISGEEITAKDFRTWHGTVLAAMALHEFEKFDSQAGAKKNIREAI